MAHPEKHIFAPCVGARKPHLPTPAVPWLPTCSRCTASRTRVNHPLPPPRGRLRTKRYPSACPHCILILISEQPPPQSKATPTLCFSIDIVSVAATGATSSSPLNFAETSPKVCLFTSAFLPLTAVSSPSNSPFGTCMCRPRSYFFRVAVLGMDRHCVYRDPREDGVYIISPPLTYPCVLETFPSVGTGSVGKTCFKLTASCRSSMQCTKHVARECYMLWCASSQPLCIVAEARSDTKAFPKLAPCPDYVESTRNIVPAGT